MIGKDTVLNKVNNMRKKFIVFAAILLLALSVVGVKRVIAQKNANELFDANIEALADDEAGAIIICSKGFCGRCFYVKHAWPYYRCLWSGDQTDYCDCDKVGQIPV